MSKIDLTNKIELLGSTKFTGLVMTNLQPSIKRIYEEAEWVVDKKNSTFKVKTKPNLSHEEKYNWDTLNYLTNIINAFDRINYSQIFITRFPQPRKYEKLGITEDQWIYYHYSYLITTLVSIYDTALLLVNQVFDLGLNPKDCKNSTVIENNKIRNTKTYSAMKSLDKLINPYRYIRNKYVHRNESPKINFIQFEESYSTLQRLGKPMVDPKKLDQIYKLSRAMIVEDLENIVLPVLDAVLVLFDSLVQQYKIFSMVNKKSQELEKIVTQIIKDDIS